MKRLVSMLVGLFLFSAVAVGNVPHLTYVKKTHAHQKVRHHHGHKATRHHARKRGRSV